MTAPPSAVAAGSAPPRGRLRRIITGTGRWGAATAVLLLPTALLVDAAAPPGPDAEMVSLMPLEPGTTWRYAVFDRTEPSGFRDRQVFWHGQDAGEGPTRVLSSHYSDHPDGPGAGEDDEYYHVGDDQIAQLGFRSNGNYTKVEPAAPVLKAPSKHPQFAVETQVDKITVKGSTELVERTDVTVSGRTFRNCAHYQSSSQVIGDRTLVREYEDWLCPGFGSVRNIDRFPELGQERTEELVAFHGPGGDWVSTQAGLETGAGGGDPDTTVGIDQGRTRAVSGRIGSGLVWSDTRNQLSSQTPAGLDGTLVLNEYDGTISALDTDTGEITWRVRLRGPLVTAPVAVGDLVLVADGAKQLWALSAETGRSVWVHGFADIVSAVPTIADDMVVVASDDGRISGLRLTTGERIWSEASGVRIHEAPAVGGDLVVTADPGGGLTARSVQDGEESWSAALDAPLGAGPVVRDGVAYTADDVGVVYAYAIDSGELLWQSRLRHYPLGTLAVSDQGVFTIGNQSHLTRLSRQSGEALWTHEIDPSVVAPTVIGDEVVTVSRTGHVSVHEVDDGREAQAWDLPASEGLRVEADPGIVGDALVVPARLGPGNTVTYYAHPLAGAASSPEAPGVWFDVETRTVGTIPAAPITTVGDDLLVAGFERTLLQVTADGTSTELFRTEDYLAGGVAMGDLVVGQRGDRWIAVPAGGGEPAWSFPAGTPQIGTLPSAGTVGGKPVAFLPVNGVGLAAVTLADGKPVWVRELPLGPSSIQPLVLPGGDVVYATTMIGRYERTTGKPLWTYPGATFATMSTHDGIVFADVIDGRDGTGLVALDAGTGKTLWHRPNDNLQILIGPVSGEGKVVAVDAAGTVTVLEASTGRELWQRTRHSGPAGTPVIDDGVLYVVETGRHEDLYQRDHRVWAHDLATGRYLGSYEPPAPGYSKVPSQSGTLDGRLLVPTTAARGPSVLIMEGVR